MSKEDGQHHRVVLTGMHGADQGTDRPLLSSPPWTTFCALLETGADTQIRNISTDQIRLHSGTKNGCYSSREEICYVDVTGEYEDYSLELSLYRGYPSRKNNRIYVTALTKEGESLTLYDKSNSDITETKLLSELLKDVGSSINNISHFEVYIYDASDGGNGSYAKYAVNGIPVKWVDNDDNTAMSSVQELDNMGAISAGGTSGNSYELDVNIEDWYRDYIFDFSSCGNSGYNASVKNVQVLMTAYMKSGEAVSLFNRSSIDVKAKRYLSTILKEHNIDRNNVSYVRVYVWVQSDGGAGAYSRCTAYGIPSTSIAKPQVRTVAIRSDGVSGCYTGRTKETDIDIEEIYDDYEIIIDTYRGTNCDKYNYAQIYATTLGDETILLFSSSNQSIKGTKKLSRLLSDKGLAISDIGHFTVKIYSSSDGGCSSYSRYNVYGVQSLDRPEIVSPSRTRLNAIQSGGTSGASYTMDIDIDSRYSEYMFDLDMIQAANISSASPHNNSIKLTAYLKNGEGSVNIFAESNTELHSSRLLSTLLKEKGIEKQDVSYVQAYVWSQADGGSGSYSKVYAYGIE